MQFIFFFVALTSIFRLFLYFWIKQNILPIIIFDNILKQIIDLGWTIDQVQLAKQLLRFSRFHYPISL